MSTKEKNKRIIDKRKEKERKRCDVRKEENKYVVILYYD